MLWELYFWLRFGWFLIRSEKLCWSGAFFEGID